MYVLDADTMDTVGTTPIGGLGCSSVIASYNNPDDPFFYYMYGSGHDSTLAAVGIRNAEANTGASIVDRGQVWYDSVMDSAISADGSILYLRGP